MEKFLEKLVSTLIDLGFKLGACIIVLLVGFKLANFIVKTIKKGKGFNKLDKNVQTFTLSFVGILIKIMVLVFAASIIGIPTASIITLIGSAGVAIGLALQGGLSNIAGGIMILIFRPFEVGDYVDTSSGAGTVKNISIFYTELLTPDNKKVMVPNGQLSNNAITNYSASKERRVDLKFPVAYESDIEEVRKVITDVCNKYEAIDKDNEIFVKVSEYADSAIIFTVRVWVKTDDYWTTYFDLNELVKKAFDKHDIVIPFNQLDVKIKK